MSLLITISDSRYEMHKSLFIVILFIRSRCDLSWNMTLNFAEVLFLIASSYRIEIMTFCFQNRILFYQILLISIVLCNSKWNNTIYMPQSTSIIEIKRKKTELIYSNKSSFIQLKFDISTWCWRCIVDSCYEI